MYPHQMKAVRPVLDRQYGAITQGQLREAGVTRTQARTLHRYGWTSPARGILLQPLPADPFKAGVAGALLASQGSVACGVTAARLHKLWGLPPWRAEELPHLLIPDGLVRHQRRGMIIHHGLMDGESTKVGGLRVTTLDRTVSDASLVMSVVDLVCLLDSAARLGWTVPPDASGHLRSASARMDPLSESPLETRLRILFADAGYPPECLQLKLYTVDGVVYARLDMAWPSLRVAVEADGRDVHDAPYALYHDRERQNEIVLDGWTILRFTWTDLMTRPSWVVQQLSRALKG